MSVAHDLVSILGERGEKGAYDTVAHVIRVEDDTAWVHIPGGIDETPVQMTIAAKEGDDVQVRVSGGTAFIVGNVTAPPTDDTAAENVQKNVDAVRQYFWHDDEGAHVSTAEGDATSGPNVLIDSDSLDIRDGQEVLASFGEVTTIGSTDGAYLEISNNKLSAKSDHSEYFNVGNLRGQNLTKTVTTTEAGQSNFSMDFPFGSDDGSFTVVSATMESSGTTTDYTSSITVTRTAYDTTVTFPVTPTSAGIDFTVIYNTDADIPYFTLGSRWSSDIGTIGNKSSVFGHSNWASGDYSVAEGTRSLADGVASHAEGSETRADGQYAHAEGYNTTASGLAAHAEGQSTATGDDMAHAEGYLTLADGKCSHAEGSETYASGNYSHAGGESATAFGASSFAHGTGVTAQADDMAVFGRYNNKGSADTDHAFVVGNGTSSDPSDAISVDWNGNIETALDTTAASGTVDGDLYAAITALGWESDVID